MLRNALRPSVGAVSSAAVGRARPWTPIGVARAALLALFVAATLAMFLGWLATADSRRSALWGFVPGSDCVSFGRGGAHCLDPSAARNRSSQGRGPADDCVSLGRGGALCRTRPGGDAGPG